MSFLGISPTDLATFLNVVTSSTVVIIAFSLLAYTITYNVRNEAARYFIVFLGCIVVAYSGDVALSRVVTANAANTWLRLQWIGIAMLPCAYYLFSYSVVRQTNGDLRWGRELSIATLLLSSLAAINGFFGTQLVGRLYFQSPFTFLDSGPYFWFFAFYFAVVLLLSLANIAVARRNVLTEDSRKRMNYLLLGFVAPGIGIFPYLIALGSLSENTSVNAIVFLLALAGNLSVAIFLVLMSYTVAYFGVLTPDRVVRYRLIRFFTRGPVIAILVIVAINTIPKIERVLGLPRDIVLYSVITGVIVCSQILLSITKTLVDRIVYREDFDEAAWLRELDRRLLTTSDLRQFLENNLNALCERFQSDGGMVAAVVGPDLMLEATIGDDQTLADIKTNENWPDALVAAQRLAVKGTSVAQPLVHDRFWVWPLLDYAHAEHRQADSSPGLAEVATELVNGISKPTRHGSDQNGTSTSQPKRGAPRQGELGTATSPTSPPENGESPSVIGLLAVLRVDEGTHVTQVADDGQTVVQPGVLFGPAEEKAVSQMIERTARALLDRKLQHDVFSALRRIIPEMDRMQELRSAATYIGSTPENPDESALLEPSPVHSPEFNSWVKDALSHYWGGPKLTRSPLTQLRVVTQAMTKSDNDPTKALRLVLGSAIERLKPSNQEEKNRPEWLLYNILSMRFIEGKKVREIANKLAMSESDLYRKQRVAIGQVARVISEMEHSGQGQHADEEQPDGEPQDEGHTVANPTQDAA